MDVNNKKHTNPFAHPIPEEVRRPTSTTSRTINDNAGFLREDPGRASRAGQSIHRDIIVLTDNDPLPSP